MNLVNMTKPNDVTWWMIYRTLALGTAMSNNAKVQALVHSWRPPTAEALAAAAATAAATAAAAAADGDAAGAASGGKGNGNAVASDGIGGTTPADGDSSDNAIKRKMAVIANAGGVYGVIQHTDAAAPAAPVPAADAQSSAVGRALH